MHETRFSRRSFFAVLFAAIAVFAIWFFRRMDLATAMQQFFAFPEDHRAMIRRRFQSLRYRNPGLYRDSILFFGLTSMRAEDLLREGMRRRVLSDWVTFLFDNRTVSWPYVNYPSVGEFQICNGLIRQV